MIALVASWVLLLLTVLTVSFGEQAATTVHQAQWQRDRQELAALARSGVAFSQRYLERWVSEKDASSDLLGSAGRNAAERESPPAGMALIWQNDPRLRALRVGAGYVSLGYVERFADGARTIHGIEDENRRVPLALLDTAAARSLGGLSPEAVRALEAMRSNPERYRNLEPQTWPGLDPRSRESLTRLVTPFAGHVNVNTASVEVLVALGVPARGAHKLVERRDGPDGVRMTADDRPFTTLDDPEGGLRECALSPDEAAAVSFLAGRGHLRTGSDVFRVRSRGWFDELGPWLEIETVVDRSSGDWEVRSWTQKRKA